jgi:hypothetical protein
MRRSVRLMLAAVGIWVASTPLALGAQDPVSAWQPASHTARRLNLYPARQLRFDDPLAAGEQRSARRPGAAIGARVPWLEESPLLSPAGTWVEASAVRTMSPPAPRRSSAADWWAPPWAS